MTEAPRPPAGADRAGAPEEPGGSSPSSRSFIRLATFAVVGLAVAALLGLLGAGLLRQQGGGFAGFGVNALGREAAIKVRPASDFTLQLLDGGAFRLSQQQGRVVVLNFWASWCPPCRQEAPTLASVAEAYRERGVVFVGVDVWDGEENARAFVREFGLRYPNGLDSRGTIAIEYGVTGLPETFLVNREGLLVRKWIGPLTRRQLEALIQEALE